MVDRVLKLYAPPLGVWGQWRRLVMEAEDRAVVLSVRTANIDQDGSLLGELRWKRPSGDEAEVETVQHGAIDVELPPWSIDPEIRFTSRGTKWVRVRIIVSVNAIVSTPAHAP